MFEIGSGPGVVLNAPNQPQIQTPMPYINQQINQYLLSNSIIKSKSNITSTNESTDYATDSTDIHVKPKQKSSRHITPKQHTIMQQPGRLTPRIRLKLVQ
jgi:hypothetical protein